MAENTRIWATFDKSFDIGCRVIKWDDPQGLDLIPSGKYNKRNVSFDELRKLIKQFTVHWSATYRAQHTFTGLKARGLSVNFSIDDDEDSDGFATIYQHLPIMYAGWSQGAGCNDLGPGVEIAYMPQAWEKDMYTLVSRQKWNVPKHETAIAPVHGTKLKVHLPTKAQINSLLQLMWGFKELFPDVPASFPKNQQGFHTYTKVDNPVGYSGFCCHYHLKRSKIDTAGLDYEKIEKEIAKRMKVGF